MEYSKRQIEVWQARERLNEKLASMSADEIIAYSKGIYERFKARTGKDLNLRMIDEESPAASGH